MNVLGEGGAEKQDGWPRVRRARIWVLLNKVQTVACSFHVAARVSRSFMTADLSEQRGSRRLGEVAIVSTWTRTA